MGYARLNLYRIHCGHVGIFNLIDRLKKEFNQFLSTSTLQGIKSHYNLVILIVVILLARFNFFDGFSVTFNIFFNSFQ